MFNKKEYQKEYREKNKKRLYEYHKKYREKNKDRIKEWRQKNRKKVRESNKKSYWKNREKCLERQIKYYKENRGKILKRNKKYRNSPQIKFNVYEKSAKKRNIKWDLTFEQFMSLWQKSCSYCGDKIETIGLDRIDSKKGYEVDNIISCCKICNCMKMDKTEKEFINQCWKIIKRRCG